MPIFKGAGTALVTPFDENEEIDFDALGRLIDFQLSGGADAIIVCGSTGEPATMTQEERIACIRFTVDKVAGRIPVIAGSGSNCTKTAICLSRAAKEAGADGLLVVTPFYNKATQNGLIQYFKEIAASVTIPIIMYNVPSRTGCNLLPHTAAALAEVPNIVGIKEASGDLSQICTLASMTRGKLAIYSGNDDQILPILSLGGMGVISVVSNLLPKQTHDMIYSYWDGKFEEALNLQLHLLPLIHALFCEVNPIPVKAALKHMGLIEGTLRSPLTKLEVEHEKLLLKEMLNARMEVL